MLGNATPSAGYGTPKSTTLAAALNMKVKKFGRTTGQTKGAVFAFNATLNVSYGPGTSRLLHEPDHHQPGDVQRRLATRVRWSWATARAVRAATTASR